MTRALRDGLKSSKTYFLRWSFEPSVREVNPKKSSTFCTCNISPFTVDATVSKLLSISQKYFGFCSSLRIIVNGRASAERWKTDVFAPIPHATQINKITAE
ncbi:hypothetical protein QP888_02575 [Corynebacterium sp. MSK297]|nr:hypothetical protein [Corynebacterium sp. MSK297]